MTQEPSTTPSTSTPGLGDLPSPRKKGSGCWKIFIAACLLLVLVTGVGIWSIVSTVHFFRDTQETAPNIAVAPDLTATEEQELHAIYRAYVEAYETKEDFDVTFTPAMLNSFFAQEIAKKKERGEFTESDAESLHVAFEGDVLVIKGALPHTSEADGKKRYYNFEARGALSARDEQVNWRLDKLKLADKEAPFIALIFLRTILKTGLENNKKKNDRLFKGLKLLEREGERIHLILDGEHLKVPRD